MKRLFVCLEGGWPCQNNKGMWIWLGKDLEFERMQADLRRAQALLEDEIKCAKLIFCICRDITSRKKAEKEREDLIKRLQESLAEIRTLRKNPAVMLLLQESPR